MTLGSINHQHGAGLVTSARSNTSRRILCPLHGAWSVATNQSSSTRSQVSVPITFAAAADGAGQGSETEQQQQSAESHNGLVLSSKHNAPMHPGLLAQGKKQRKARGGNRKPVILRTLPETAKQTKTTARRQVKPRQPAAPAMVVHPAVQATSSNVQQPRGRGRPPTAVQKTPAEGSAAIAAAAINGGQPAGSASSSNVQQPRRRSRLAKPAYNTSGEASAAAAAATVAGAPHASTAAGDVDTSSNIAPPLQHQRKRGRPSSLSKAQQQVAGTTKQQIAGSAQLSLTRSQLPLAGHSEQHHAQQQQQGQDTRQLPDQGQPVVDFDTNSSDSFLAEGSASGEVLSNSDFVLDSLLDSSSGDTTGITNQQRVEMERLFGLSAASIPGMSAFSATSTAAFDSADEGGNGGLGLPPQRQHQQHQQQQQQPEQALQQRQQQQQQSALAFKGVKRTSVIQGKSRYVDRPSGQQQEREQDDATDLNSSNIISSDSTAAGAADHDDVAAAGPEQQLGPASPLEPSPLEPIHPEMQYDVQLQEEQNRLQGHRQLLHDLKQGAAQYQQYLSNPVVSSLAFLTAETLQALNTARQFIQQHPELARWVTAGQQDLDHAVQVSRKANEGLRNTQELIILLERILQQEEQRAGSLVKSSSTERTSQAVERPPALSSHNITDEGSPARNQVDPAGSAAAAAGHPMTPSDERTQRASESLDMLQSLLPQLKSAGTSQPQLEPGGDADPDPDEDYQWG